MAAARVRRWRRWYCWIRIAEGGPSTPFLDREWPHKSGLATLLPGGRRHFPISPSIGHNAYIESQARSRLFYGDSSTPSSSDEPAAVISAAVVCST